MGIAGSSVLIASSMCHKNLKIQVDAHNFTSDKFKLWLFVASGIIYVPSNQDYDQGEESVLNLLSFCSRSRRRAAKGDKRMVLVHTHGIFIA
jgi:Tfp pilus assembly protein PilZ